MARRLSRGARRGIRRAVRGGPAGAGEASRRPGDPGGAAERFGPRRVLSATHSRRVAMQSTAVETSETTRLIGSDRVEGTAVNDRSGSKLGTIDRVMIDKHTGKVAYAVMSFGGFLGIGERYHPLPWAVLDYDTLQNTYVVDLYRQTLDSAPPFGSDARGTWRTDERPLGK